MFRKLLATLGLAACALAPLTAANNAQAVIFYAANGEGGFNAYERVDTQVNYATAITNSAVAFPQASQLRDSNSSTGHLGAYATSNEYELFVALRNAAILGVGAPANVYIGLTDNPTFAPGAIEDGNNTAGSLPTNGTIANVGVVGTLGDGQRGAGWTFTNGQANTFHQRTPGVSVWGGGEPNGGFGENVAEVRGDGFLNDIGEGSTRPYLREWSLNMGKVEFKDKTPGLVITDIRNVGGVNNGNYKAIAAAPPAGSTSVIMLTPDINLGSGAQGVIGGDDQFPRGSGDNFVIVLEGYIEIPTSGAWTLQMNQDDAIHITIGTNGQPFVFEDLPCCDTTRTTAILSQGIHPIKVIFAEFGGGDHVELAMAFGAGITDGSQFRIVGDVAGGGLRVFAANAPEPGTVGLLGLAGLALLRRRRAA